jgi:hypothetical protein
LKYISAVRGWECSDDLDHVVFTKTYVFGGSSQNPLFTCVADSLGTSTWKTSIALSGLGGYTVEGVVVYDYSVVSSTSNGYNPGVVYNYNIVGTTLYVLGKDITIPNNSTQCSVGGTHSN